MKSCIKFKARCNVLELNFKLDQTTKSQTCLQLLKLSLDGLHLHLVLPLLIVYIYLKNIRKQKKKTRLETKGSDYIYRSINNEEF